MPPTTSQVEQAVGLLTPAPLHTNELAGKLLRLQGTPGAAAAVLFGLLGSDPRFVVDKSGVWHLRDHDYQANDSAESEQSQILRIAADARSLLEEKWTVVDVETTGGGPDKGHRITEIALVEVDGGEIKDSFSTLVNPERYIPGHITDLTGITNSMVAGSPRFHEVSRTVRSKLSKSIFTAHNASFDWRFVSAEVLRADGINLDSRQLCTVRLARRLLPELPSRSLGSLIEYFGLPVKARHRAEEDAVATAKVLLHMLEMLSQREVSDWAALQQLLASKKSSRKRKSRSPLL